MELGNNLKVKEFIEKICSQIESTEVHSEIRLEFESHISEITEEYISQGFSENEAIMNAISQMGDSTDIGQKLNDIYKPKVAWVFSLFTLAFLSIGLIATYFLNESGTIEYSNSIFLKSSYHALIGIALAAGLYFFDYRKFKPYSKYIYIGSLLLLFYSIAGGPKVNGQSIVEFGVISFSFAEISPFIFVIALAGLLENWNWNQTKGFIQGLIILLLPLVLILATPSFSSGLIYFITLPILMVISGLKKRFSLIPIGLGFIGFAFAIGSAPYRLERLLTFLNPNKDPLGSGWINIQLTKTLNSSGPWGNGFESSSLLPEIHTNYIFSYLVHGFGWIFGVLLVTLILSFVMYIINLTQQVNSHYDKLILSGFASIFSAQFILNILMNLGVAPLVGINLPFISYGGTQLLTNMIAIGIMLSIYARKNIVKILAK